MAQLHPLVAGFAPDAYDRGRPGYGPEVVAELAASLGLSAGDRVLDLGAGTGLLTRELAAFGLDVVAVEPVEAMRARLAEAVGADRALAGTAEAIPLPDASVRAITMGDAFHWFDERPAIAEFRRVLEPGGGVAVLWSFPSWRSAAPGWAGELGRYLGSLRGEHPQWKNKDRTVADVFAEVGGFAPMERREVASERDITREDIVAYSASISWVGVLPDAERSRVLAEVDALLRRHDVERVTETVTTEVWVTRLL